MTINFNDQVAIVTGSGNGLGRSHAMALAERGAKVVINDLGGARDGTGGSSDAAKEVVALIEAKGGQAIANGANVADFAQVEEMIAQTMEKWGRVVDVHLMGSVNCTKAAWDIMREQNYGRVVMTTSSSGMYGNFGQANYGAAKMALVGFMNTLVLEGKKYGINVNTLAPTAGTRMLEDIIPDQKVMDAMTVESVTAGLLTLCDRDAPNRSILCAGAGGYATTHIYETEGIYLPPEQQTPENVRANIDKINSTEGEKILTAGFEQTNKFVEKALKFFAENES
jgi:NAD(P)-dependent dehydrogenase (short-subunit alcohol dehydrogenase family)